MKEKYHYAIANNVWGERRTLGADPTQYRVGADLIGRDVDVIVWYCCEYFQLEGLNIKVDLYHEYNLLGCWGDSEQISDTEYSIRICTDQTLRDFVATVCHEMVHVNQWVTNKWSGDGEKEAEKLQYKMADKFWKEWK